MSQPTPDGSPIEDYDVALPETAEHHDETDVPAALERITSDGPGEGDPGPSDFQGFATEGVEKDSDQ